MYSLNDCLEILVENGYIVSMEVEIKGGDENALSIRAAHRATNNRYTSKGLELVHVANKLVDFVKSNAPLDVEGYEVI